MVSALISRVVILVFGTLYPAYKSYKAVKTKNVKEYVKWMMYWIVFALFTFVETFADLFVAWLPFYYEIKILFVLWLLSPATKGASILYRKFIHPQLSKREKEIDAHLDRVTDQGYAAVLSLGSKGFNYATNVVLTTAIKGQAKIAENLKRSYSLNDVSEDKEGTTRPAREMIHEVSDEDEADNRMIEESYQQEMLEKDIDTTEQPVRRRKLKKEELANISEGEEELNKSNLKRAYSAKDASHYGTLPRSSRSRSTRSAASTTAPTNRHSYHE